MAGYLVLNDYNVTIQAPALAQWLASNDALRLQTEPRAQAKIKEYLVQRYDLIGEFKPTTVYSDATTYQANALTQLNYPAWVAQSYTVGAYVSFTDGNVYRCIQNATSAQTPTNSAYWLIIGTQCALFYLAYPYQVFDLQAVYAIGDTVFWNGKAYQCLTATTYPSHYVDLQAYEYKNIPPINYFPDDKINGATQWGAGVSYSISNIYPTETAMSWSSATSYTTGQLVTYNGVLWQAIKSNINTTPGADIVTWQSVTWTLGDNRNQSIVDTYVAITLYYLSFRISPKVVPQWIQSKYDEAKSWLQQAAEGGITLDVAELQPSQGARIRFGGNIKQQNGY